MYTDSNWQNLSKRHLHWRWYHINLVCPQYYSSFLQLNIMSLLLQNLQGYDNRIDNVHYTRSDSILPYRTTTVLYFALTRNRLSLHSCFAILVIVLLCCNKVIDCKSVYYRPWCFTMSNSTWTTIYLHYRSYLLLLTMNCCYHWNIRHNTIGQK